MGIRVLGVTGLGSCHMSDCHTNGVGNSISVTTVFVQ
jgi:hypothetical protein